MKLTKLQANKGGMFANNLIQSSAREFGLIGPSLIAEYLILLSGKMFYPALKI